MAQPSPEQIKAFIAAKNAEAERQLALEANSKQISVEELKEQKKQNFLALAKAREMTPEALYKELQMEAMRAQQQGRGSPQPGQPGQQQKPGQPPSLQQGPPQQQMQRVAVSPGQPVDPKALAVAKFLRSQALKPRTCILNGERKDMFKGMPSTAQNLSTPSDQMRFLTYYSQASYARPSVPRLRQSRRKEELPPSTRDRRRLSRGRLQAPPTLLSRATRKQGRPARRSQPRQAQEPDKGPVDREDRGGTAF